MGSNQPERRSLLPGVRGPQRAIVTWPTLHLCSGRKMMRTPIPLLQRAVGGWPRLYIGLLRLRYRNKRFARRIVGPATDVVIEGFPRSGNSYCKSCVR